MLLFQKAGKAEWSLQNLAHGFLLGLSKGALREEEQDNQGLSGSGEWLGLERDYLRGNAIFPSYQRFLGPWLMVVYEERRSEKGDYRKFHVSNLFRDQMIMQAWRGPDQTGCR